MAPDNKAREAGASVAIDYSDYQMQIAPAK